MRLSIPFCQGIRGVAAAALVLWPAPACKPTAPAPGPVSKAVATNAGAAAPSSDLLAAQYVSVFEDLPPPKGRDPFFPNSRRREPVAAQSNPGEKSPPASGLQLKGTIVGADHSIADINSSILEVGEEATVRVPGGSVRLKCLEIGQDHAVVQVEGELQPRRLELNKKGH
jgi:hypothetical protein